MNDIDVKGLSDAQYASLRHEAEKLGLSVEDFARRLAEEALLSGRERLRLAARRAREREAGRSHGDSTEIQRAIRDA